MTKRFGLGSLLILVLYGWSALVVAAPIPDIDFDKLPLPAEMLKPPADSAPSTLPNPPATLPPKTPSAKDIDLDKLDLPAEMVTPSKKPDANKSNAANIPYPNPNRSYSSFSWGGYAKNETAYRFDTPRTFTKIRNILYLDAQLTLGSWFKFNTAGWGYHDLAYDLFNYQTISGRQRRNEAEPLVFNETLPSEKDSPVAALREFYFDFYLKNLDFRLGKQYIIWGVLEGVRVVDEVNPMDFRELILPELLDYRISQWSAKLDYYDSFADYEFIWIPDLQFHKPAPRGSEWELFQVLPQTTKPKSWDPRFSEVGARVSKKILGIDFSLSYWYGWDLYPTVFRLISSTALRSAPPGTDIPVYPTYTRITMYGLTFSRELEGNILKGEFAYVKDKYFALVDVDSNRDGYLDNDGEVKRNHIRWGLGYDFNLWGADFSTALTQWIIINYRSSILQDEVDTAFNVFIRKPLQKRSAVFTLLLIKLINFNETLVKPKVTFELSDRFQLATGVDWFVGEPTQFGRRFDINDPGGLVDVAQSAQFLGNFRNNRRIFVEFKYSF